MKVNHLIILILMVNLGLAQEVKFEKVSKEMLEEKFYVKDSSASAVVLARKVRIYYDYKQNSGFQVIRNVKERIKIYNKSGFGYATIKERLYKGSGAKESVGSLKGNTYNLENGQIVKSKIKGSEIFVSSLSKYRNEEKFTMPNVKEGSILEYEYRITSPYAYYIDEIPFQYYIPVQEEEVSVSIPEYFNFKTAVRGYLPVSPVVSSKFDKINFTSKSGVNQGLSVSEGYNNSNLNYTIKISTFYMKDVPALQRELYVNNMNNYRSAIKYELQFVKYPNSPPEEYATTWEKVIKKIYKNQNFGNQIEATRFLREDVQSIINGMVDNQQKTKAIFQHVQNRMSWNGIYGKYSNKGVKNAYKDKTGNVGDINLLLVAMLKEAGLNANPVLVSTRNHGVPLFPTREGFNYVVASVEEGDQIILLDACNKYTNVNLLPTKALNWFGRVVYEDGASEKISMFPKTNSKQMSMMNVNLKPNGDIEGKLRKNYTGQNAYLYRNSYNQIDQESYLEKVENDHGGMEISNYAVKNKTDLSKPIVESYDFYLESQAEVINDKIYFSPMFFDTEKENPFKLDKRDYPIDFAHPWQRRYIVNIAIPDGYEVISLPENLIMTLPENLGAFSYKLGKRGNTLQLKTDIQFNTAIIAPQDYAGVKELYKKMIEKETEKVVLSKI